MNLDSEANLSNLTFGFHGLKHWEYVFCGIKGIIPVYRDPDNEKWFVSGTLNQTNSLKYGWTRAEAYLGCPLNPFLNPYVGLRWSESRQDRTGFIVSGTPVGGSATETILSQFFMIGARGDICLNRQWNITYSISYFDPIYSKITNSALPGWKVSNAGGYAYEAQVEADCSFTPKWFLSFLLYGGQVYWNGSDRQVYADGTVKWPENDTRYLGGMLSLGWVF